MNDGGLGVRGGGVVLRFGGGVGVLSVGCGVFVALRFGVRLWCGGEGLMVVGVGLWGYGFVVLASRRLWFRLGWGGSAAWGLGFGGAGECGRGVVGAKVGVRREVGRCCPRVGGERGVGLGSLGDGGLVCGMGVGGVSGDRW